MPSTDAIRARFPALATSPDSFLDNAGGSQLPGEVIEAMAAYMRTTYVQLGADYETSRRATAVVDAAHAYLETFVGAGDRGRVILGPSTTALCMTLADAVARAGAGRRSEVVVAESGHEANLGPWMRLADRGFTVRVWPVEPESLSLRVDELAPLLSDRTRIVAFPHVSNLLGGIEDARAFSDAAHEVGARVVVDGVAFAPHRAVDVEALGADWYGFSTYKVLGPHLAALFGTHEAIAELEGPNHGFIPRDDIPYKFEPGGVSHEACAGILALRGYLAFLADAADPSDDRAIVVRAYDEIARRETGLQTRLIEGIERLPGARLLGPSECDGATRVSTVSFTHETRRSRDLVLPANAAGHGIRYGHFYAHRLAVRLAEEGRLHDVEDGAVRISALHYNDEAEIDGVLAALAREIG